MDRGKRADKMGIESYQREVLRRQQELAKLQQRKSSESAKGAEESRRASADVDAAGRTTSLSSRQSKLRDAQRHQDNAVRAQKNVADIEAQIAREQGYLNDALRKLSDAQAQEDRKRAREMERSEREHERRMRAISGTLARHDSLHKEARDAILRLQQLPERTSVLFLAANPLDQQQLRLDEEARAINEMIRKAEHRDAIRLEARWALRPGDVLQALNEVNPAIVHFSGHGSESEELVFQASDGSSRLVSKEAIVQAMAVGSDSIQLVFFNSCYSRAQAEAVVHHVPASIGMNTSIGDDAARVFASQFYSAIGFGLSVRRAFDQARTALLLEGIPEESTPELLVAEGMDPAEMILVRPPDLP